MSDPERTDGKHQVDPWRFAGSFLTRVLSGQIPDEPAHAEIPWTPVTKPLAKSRVALLSTAGLSQMGDSRFDMDGERARPTWGDPSWRRIDSAARQDELRADHLHIDTGYIERDLNVALPLDRLRELVSAGEVGEVAPTHYSIMGFQGNDTRVLENESAPEIAAAMRNEGVDLALLAPV
jgi:D-proline reductase (dithiol) PrdB